MNRRNIPVVLIGDLDDYGCEGPEYSAGVLIPEAPTQTGASESSVSGESDGLGCRRGTLCHNKVIPYSRKIWRGIKFGGLAVNVTTAKFNSRQYFRLYGSYKSMSQTVQVIHQLLYRRQRFQKEFYTLGKVRSLIPKVWHPLFSHHWGILYRWDCSKKPQNWTVMIFFAL